MMFIKNVQKPSANGRLFMIKREELLCIPLGLYFFCTKITCMTKLNIPKISIITVTYNAGIMLEKTLNSIQKQQYGNKETIVVDGKSTDNSLTVIQRYTGNGTVTQWAHPINPGDNSLVL